MEQMEKPDVDVPVALELAGRLYGLAGGTAAEMVSYDDRNFCMRPHEIVGNPFVGTVAPDGYTLKVTNSLDSRDQDFIEGQNILLAFLADHGVKCPRPVKNKHGKMQSVESFRVDGPVHAVRLLEFVPGHILGKVPWQSDFSLQVGRALANINCLMDEVDIPSIKNRQTEWSLWEAPAVLKYLDVVADPKERAIVEEVLAAFQRDTESHADYLRDDSGLVHGDFNQFNIVVDRRPEAPRSDAYALVGVLDLGDTHCAPRLFDVALAATYMALTSGEVEAVGNVLEGYSGRRPVSATGVNLLRVCVCTRLCQSLLMGLKTHQLDPQNTYVLDSQEKGWPLLRALWNVPHGTFEQKWLDQLKRSQKFEEL